MRLDKYLATYAGLSRKEAKAAVKSGRVQVDGRTAEKFDEKIQKNAVVYLNQKLIVVEEHIYLMLNKPAGVVSATRDDRERTVVDLVDCAGRELFPVGRLDKDAEGLLLLTDDGALAHRLLSPKYHVKKCYYVRYEGVLSEDAAELFRQGVDIGEKKHTLPAELEILGGGQAKLTISEGKFHQVKRMIAKVGGRVTALKRLTMGNLVLDDNLAPGEYRRLTKAEIDDLAGQ